MRLWKSRPGSPCDDGDVCTTGDVIDSNCNCTGILLDSDNDGTCDAQDGCPNDPNKIDPGTCGCGNPEPGSPCNDGDVCTTGDVIDSNCNCTGVLLDSDNDGTCDAQDGCPNDPNKIDPGTCGCGNPEPGTPCDDGDPGTINDVIGANCICSGVPISGGPPSAVCGVITVYVDPLDPDFDGPGADNVWLISAADLDAGSSSFDADPVIEVKRYLSSILFDWTTSGACIDVLPNGIVNSRDHGTIYRLCLPAQNADFNRWRLYQLRITDSYGMDACTGLIRVVPANGMFVSPIVHLILPAQGNYDSDSGTDDLKLPIHGEGDAVYGFTLYPNPGTNIVHLKWSSGRSESVTLRIMDARQQLVLDQEVQASPGDNFLMLDLSRLRSGVYVFILQGKKWLKTAKWIKIDF